MIVTVCEFPDEAHRKDSAWNGLVEAASEQESDLVVLPEMPFCPWIFVGESIDESQWKQAISDHEKMIDRLHELRADYVISSRPTQIGSRRLNQGFIWSKLEGYRSARAKWYLPDEPTGREATWFDKGDRHFQPERIGEVIIGLQLCSEMMYPEHARELGSLGAHIIAQPRASSDAQRWPVAAAMSAIVSGCFVLSTNRRSLESNRFPGGSWIISPDGVVLASTTQGAPAVTLSISLEVAEQAKNSYPRDMYRRY